jgi:hypothetical protein
MQAETKSALHVTRLTDPKELCQKSSVDKSWTEALSNHTDDNTYIYSGRTKYSAFCSKLFYFVEFYFRPQMH